MASVGVQVPHPTPRKYQFKDRSGEDVDVDVRETTLDAWCGNELLTSSLAARDTIGWSTVVGDVPGDDARVERDGSAGFEYAPAFPRRDFGVLTALTASVPAYRAVLPRVSRIGATLGRELLEQLDPAIEKGKP
jgi:hypothetical protein